MSRIENQKIVLRLNAVWQAIGEATVKEAITAMNSRPHDADVAPAVGLDFDYAQKPDGTWDFENPIYINPVKWDEWIELPIREFDLFIRTPRRHIRVPTVIIAVNYRHMPRKEKRATPSAVMERDKMICQYSGKKLTKREATIDHIVPSSRGGKDTWTNQVVCDKELNHKKGDRLNHEAGLTLIREPKAPLSMPISAMITEARHYTWKAFLHS